MRRETHARNKDAAGTGWVHSFERPEPRIERSDDVLIRMKEVGLDGTDFNMVKNRLQDIADERDEIVLGHEGVGVVEAVGNGVTSVAPGDKVVLTVRRGCGRCEPCRHDESDMCMTGLYNERGLHKLDGFRGLLGEMVTFRVSFQDCEKAFTNDDPNQIKTVVEMDPW